MEQEEFFPQKQLKKDIDYVDLCTLEDFQSGSGGKKDWSFSDLEKDKYICYRTGYTNEHFKGRGTPQSHRNVGQDESDDR